MSLSLTLWSTSNGYVAVDYNGKSTCVSFTEFSIWTSRQVLVTQTSPRNPTQKGLGTRVYRELYSLSLYIFFFTWPYKWIISSLKCSIPEQHIICYIWGLVFELRSPEGLSVQITYRKRTWSNRYLPNTCDFWCLFMEEQIKYSIKKVSFLGQNTSHILTIALVLFCMVN